MRRLDPELAERFIRMVAEGAALRDAVGVSRLRLFFEVEQEYLRATPAGAIDPAAHPGPPDYETVLARSLAGIRSRIKADPRIQGAYAEDEAALERLLSFHQYRVLPYYQALGRKWRHPRDVREWREVARASLWGGL